MAKSGCLSQALSARFHVIVLATSQPGRGIIGKVLVEPFGVAGSSEAAEANAADGIEFSADAFVLAWLDADVALLVSLAAPLWLDPVPPVVPEVPANPVSVELIEIN